MAQDSKIEWTNHTANLWWGCTKVHTGCDHCYAETLSRRWDFHVWGNNNPRREIKSVWNDLDKFQRLAKEKGEMHRVFIGSMMDIFEKPMPMVDSIGHKVGFDTGYIRQLLFEAIGDYRYANLLFLFLTKRPSNINKYIPESWKLNPPSNVMFGTSPCNQKTADKLIPQLLKVKGKHFLSMEPLLGPVDLTHHLCDFELSLNSDKGNVHWVIVGGESGPKKRPMDLAWARLLRDQCAINDVPFFMKQIDKIQQIPDDLMIRQFAQP